MKNSEYLIHIFIDDITFLAVNFTITIPSFFFSGLILFSNSQSRNMYTCSEYIECVMEHLN
jgi:hypothetical protein